MQIAWLGCKVGVAFAFCSVRAWASGCPGHVDVPSPAPPEVVVFSIKECCGGWSQPTAGEFVPTVLDGGEEVEDTGRARVLVTFSDEAGLRVGRGERELDGGTWRFVGDNERVVYFQVDSELMVTPPEVPRLEVSESYSGNGYDVYSEHTYPVAYVSFDVLFDAPAFAVEIYAVDGGQRSGEPAAFGPSSYQQVFIGEAPQDCQGIFDVPTDATYDVRVAAYADNGELGEWSEFERIEVPAMPSGGCALSPGGGGTNLGWVLVLGSAVVVGLRGRHRRGQPSA